MENNPKRKLNVFGIEVKDYPLKPLFNLKLHKHYPIIPEENAHGKKIGGLFNNALGNMMFGKKKKED